MLVSPNTAYHSSKLWFNKSFKSIAKYSKFILVTILGPSPGSSSQSRLASPLLAGPKTQSRALRMCGFCFCWAAAAKSAAYNLKFKYFLPAPVKYFLCVKPLLTPSDQFWWHGDVTSNSQLLHLRFYDYNIDILNYSQEAMLKFAGGDSTSQLRWQSMTNHFNILPLTTK